MKEEVTSASFGNAIPADQRHSWKGDGAKLNAESEARLKKYGIKIKYAGQRTNLAEHVNIRIGKDLFYIFED